MSREGSRYEIPLSAKATTMWLARASRSIGAVSVEGVRDDPLGGYKRGGGNKPTRRRRLHEQARAAEAAMMPQMRSGGRRRHRYCPAALVSVEIALHRGERGKVLRQHPPLTAGPRDIQDRVKHGSQLNLARPAQRLGRRHMGVGQRPFRIRDIACVSLSLSLILPPSDFRPLCARLIASHNLRATTD